MADQALADIQAVLEEESVHKTSVVAGTRSLRRRYEVESAVVVSKSAKRTRMTRHEADNNRNQHGSEPEHHRILSNQHCQTNVLPLQLETAARAILDSMAVRHDEEVQQLEEELLCNKELVELDTSDTRMSQMV